MEFLYWQHSLTTYSTDNNQSNLAGHMFRKHRSKNILNVALRLVYMHMAVTRVHVPHRRPKNKITVRS